MFELSIEEGFGSKRFGRVRCVVTHADLQPRVAAYLCRPGDSTWRAMALDVLRIEDGLITEIPRKISGHATMYFDTHCEVRNDPEGEGLRLIAQS